MTLESSAYRGFSKPSNGLDPALLELIVTQHAQNTVRHFVERYKSTIVNEGAGVLRLFDDWLQSESSFETVWNPAFGEIYAAINQNSGETEPRAALLALRLSECGSSGDWALRFPEPTRLTFGGWCLPIASALELSASGDRVILKLRSRTGWHSARFERCGEGWTTDDAELLSVYEQSGIRWTVLPRDLLTPGASIRRMTETDEGDATGSGDAASLVQGCSEALGLIRQYAGEYEPWLQGVVRNLIALPATGEYVRTQSHKFAPGVVSTSAGQHRCGLAETLVHEATHQYFYIAGRMGQVEDGTDQTLYYSPFRSAPRPIYNILLSYHAFANVILFFRTVLRNGLAADPVSADIAQRRMAQIEVELRPLAEALRSTAGLTPLGRALWEPLREQLEM